MKKLITRTDIDRWRWYGDMVSVTTVLGNAVANPSLMKWFKKNSKNQIEKRQKDTSRFGQYCHKYIEHYYLNQTKELKDVSEKIEKEFGEQFDGFKKQFDEFDSKYKIEPEHLEVTVGSDRYGYAGTCDFVGKVNGKPYVIDWKTSLYDNKTFQWQSAAYKEALIENGIIDESYGIAVVRFPRIEWNNDGATFDVKIGNHSKAWGSFIKALDLFKDLYEEKLEKVNYKWI